MGVLVARVLILLIAYVFITVPLVTCLVNKHKYSEKLITEMVFEFFIILILILICLFFTVKSVSTYNYPIQFYKI